MARKNIKSETETEVLVESRRRCAFCFGLKSDTSVKKGQIAHIDQDNSNAAKDNLVFLCILHHDEYDSKTSQSKGLTKKELKHYRSLLYEYLAKENAELWIDYVPYKEQENIADRTILPIDIYKEKIAIYRIVRGFLSLAMRDGNIDIESLFKFAKETDEAIFLFDPEVSIYIHELYKKAVELRYTATMIKHHNVIGKERSKHVNRNAELLLWLSEQVKEVRAIFSKHIAL
jgi:hypothetical protein